MPLFLVSIENEYLESEDITGGSMVLGQIVYRLMGLLWLSLGFDAFLVT